MVVVRHRIVVVGGAFLMSIAFCLLLTLQPHAIVTVREYIVTKTSGSRRLAGRPDYLEVDKYYATGNEKLAYVTFLSGTIDQGEDYEQDTYFSAVRTLVWQLLHLNETRTCHDVVVMVTPTVSDSRRKRLEKDGAILQPVEFLHTNNDKWIIAEKDRWDDVITKMRVWEMTQYDRILMLDGDTMLRSSLDGVFDDPRAQLLQTKGPDVVNRTALSGEAPLPQTYLLASVSEVRDSRHEFPPSDKRDILNIGRMNAGFFILAPSVPAFDYYKSLMDIPNAFNPLHPDQNLINAAHTWNGTMPWREVDHVWNTRCPNENDFEQGLVSMHEKWWAQPYIYDNTHIKQWLLTRRWEMKGWYDAHDLKQLRLSNSTGNPRDV